MLTPADVVALTGVPPTVAQDGPDWTSAVDWGGLADSACVSVPSAGDTTVYTRSGYVAIRGNRMLSPLAQNYQRAELMQAVGFFVTADDAAALLTRTRGIWEKCQNRSYAIEFASREHGHIDVGGIVAGPNRLSITLWETEHPTWRCVHTITTRDVVAVDVRLCVIGDPGAAADNAVQQIIGKLPH